MEGIGCEWLVRNKSGTQPKRCVKIVRSSTSRRIKEGPGDRWGPPWYDMSGRHHSLRSTSLPLTHPPFYCKIVPPSARLVLLYILLSLKFVRKTKTENQKKKKVTGMIASRYGPLGSSPPQSPSYDCRPKRVNHLDFVVHAFSACNGKKKLIYA